MNPASRLDSPCSMKFLEQAERRLGRLSEERFYLILIAVLAALAAAQVNDFATGLHRNFLTIACDTAAFQNTIVNTLHGNWFRDTAYDGPNYLGLHSIFILLLLAPLYALSPSVDTLFLLQIVAIYSTALPLYCVAVELLKRPLTAFLCTLAVMLNPIFYHMALAPFHPESWILATVLWSYFFYLRNREKAFWICFAIGITSGEQAAFIFFALGLSLWFYEDGMPWRKRYGKRLILASLGWLVLMFGVLAPLVRVPEQRNLIADHYADWHVKTIFDLVAALADEPMGTVMMLFSPMRWAHLAPMVGLPLLLAFFNRRAVILLLPFPVYFLMNFQDFHLYFHAYYYQFAFLAGYLGLLLFLERWPINTRLGFAVLVATAYVNLTTLGPAVGLYAALGMGRDDAFNNNLCQVFARIPPEATVYSPHRYSAYLSNRANMVMGDLSDEKRDFKQLVDDQFKTTQIHSEQIDYIVCDRVNDQCGWRRDFGKDDGKAKLRTDEVDRLLKSGQWQVFFDQNSVVVLRRTGETPPP